jgi:hypothetical protein
MIDLDLPAVGRDVQTEPQDMIMGYTVYITIVSLLPICSSLPNTFECIFQMTVDLANRKLLHYVDERALPIKPLEERNVRDIVNKLDVDMLVSS